MTDQELRDRVLVEREKFLRRTGSDAITTALRPDWDKLMRQTGLAVEIEHRGLDPEALAAGR